MSATLINTMEHEMLPLTGKRKWTHTTVSIRVITTVAMPVIAIDTGSINPWDESDWWMDIKVWTQLKAVWNFVQLQQLTIQATGLDACASRVKCPAWFVSHWHNILADLLSFTAIRDVEQTRYYRKAPWWSVIKIPLITQDAKKSSTCKHQQILLIKTI